MAVFVNPGPSSVKRLNLQAMGCRGFGDGVGGGFRVQTAPCLCQPFSPASCLASPQPPALPPSPSQTLHTTTNLLQPNSVLPQAAVPKYMRLRLEPASGTTLPPGGPAGGTVVQQLYVHNSMHGQKGLIMRLKISFVDGDGTAVEEQAEVSNFPPGL